VPRTRQSNRTPTDPDPSLTELFPGLVEAPVPVKNKGGRPKKTPVPAGVGKYDKVRKAIVSRDISEVSWELLDQTLTDIERTGESPLGKSILMELIRTISVQKGNGEIENRLQRVGELKTWLRKA